MTSAWYVAATAESTTRTENSFNHNGRRRFSGMPRSKSQNTKEHTKNTPAYSGNTSPAATCALETFTVWARFSPDSFASNELAAATNANATEIEAYRRDHAMLTTDTIIPMDASGMSTTTTCTMSGWTGMPPRVTA